MSEKFQLVLDVAQKAQVLCWAPARPARETALMGGRGSSWFNLTMVPGGWSPSRPGPSQVLGEAQNGVHCRCQRVNP